MTRGGALAVAAVLLGACGQATLQPAPGGSPPPIGGSATPPPPRSPALAHLSGDVLVTGDVSISGTFDTSAPCPFSVTSGLFHWNDVTVMSSDGHTVEVTSGTAAPLAQQMPFSLLQVTVDGAQYVVGNDPSETASASYASGSATMNWTFATGAAGSGHIDGHISVACG